MLALGLHAKDAYNIPPFSDSTYVLNLTANSAKQITVPANAAYVIFAFTMPIWVRVNNDATVPSDDITNGAAPVLNPGLRRVSPGQIISVISAYDCLVSLAFYK